MVENGGDRRQPPRYLDPDGRQKARKVDKVSRRMFPMTFVLFNIVYWILSLILDLHSVNQSINHNVYWILYSVPFDGFSAATV